jgi:hypothetical protein
MAPITRKLRTILKLPLVAVIFALLCIWQSVTLPIFEAQDEVAHFKYADYLARTWLLPDMRGELPSHEASQPPLYYLAVAAIIAPVDRSDIAAHTQVNEERNDLSLSPDRAISPTRYWYLHTEPQGWPYRGVVLAGHIARLFSVVLGLLTLGLCSWNVRQLLLAAHRIGWLRWLDADRATWLATIVIAFNPKFVHLSSVVNNDIAAACAASAACAWLLHVWPNGSIRHAQWRDLATAGTLCGLAALCKLNGMATLAMLTWLLIAMARLHGRRVTAQLALAAAAAFALTAGIWFMHNMLAYGHPLAWAETRVAHRLEQRPEPLALIDAPGALLEFVLSIWSQIGWYFNFDAAINTWPMLGLCLALAGVAALLLQRRSVLRDNWRRQRLMYSPLTGVLLWSAGTLAMFIPWFFQYEGTSNARLVMTLLAPAAALLVVGWQAAARLWPQLRPVLSNIQPLALLAWIGLSVATPAYFLPEAYAKPTLVNASRLDLSARFGDSLEMRGATATFDGDTVYVRALLGASEQISRSYRIDIQVTDGSGEVIGTLRAIPGAGGFSTLYWPAGYHFEEIFEVPLSRPPSDLSAVSVGWYYRSRAEPELAFLPLVDGTERRLDVRVDPR